MFCSAIIFLFYKKICLCSCDVDIILGTLGESETVQGPESPPPPTLPPRMYRNGDPSLYELSNADTDPNSTPVEDSYAAQLRQQAKRLSRSKGSFLSGARCVPKPLPEPRATISVSRMVEPLPAPQLATAPLVKVGPPVSLLRKSSSSPQSEQQATVHYHSTSDPQDAEEATLPSTDQCMQNSDRSSCIRRKSDSCRRSWESGQSFLSQSLNSSSFSVSSVNGALPFGHSISRAVQPYSHVEPLSSPITGADSNETSIDNNRNLVSNARTYQWEDSDHINIERSVVDDCPVKTDTDAARGFQNRYDSSRDVTATGNENTDATEVSVTVQASRSHRRERSLALNTDSSMHTNTDSCKNAIDNQTPQSMELHEFHSSVATDHHQGPRVIREKWMAMDRAGQDRSHSNSGRKIDTAIVVPSVRSTTVCSNERMSGPSGVSKVQVASSTHRLNVFSTDENQGEDQPAGSSEEQKNNDDISISHKNIVALFQMTGVNIPLKEAPKNSLECSSNQNEGGKPVAENQGAVDGGTLSRGTLKQRLAAREAKRKTS